MTANIFNIARGSLHDGKGIRTVVYFKGCSLCCKWCHNPEGISPHTEVIYHKSRCIKCGRCVKLCPEHHQIRDGKMVYIRENCEACVKCAQECPNEALSVCGKQMTTQEVVAEVIKDKHYFDASGGVTLSGGECLLYPDFVAELLKMCKKENIGTAVETAFHVPWENIEAVREYVDQFIIDIKHADGEIHRRYTGADNRLILYNIAKISQIHQDILIRIPLIPNVNDDENNLIRTAELINSFGQGIKTVELLKYNNMAGNKYEALGKASVLFAENTQDEDDYQFKRGILKAWLNADIHVF